jgi:hypothetical protein
MKTKTICFALLFFLLTACGMNINTDQDKVTAVAAEIADFELPTGYSPEFTASFDVYTLVSYTPGKGSCHLYLVQSQNAADTEKLLRAMKNIIPGEYDPEAGMTVIETRPILVRGEQTTLILSEGVNGDGETCRQAVVAFKGNGGPALLVYSSPVAASNLETVEALIASIH